MTLLPAEERTRGQQKSKKWRHDEEEGENKDKKKERKKSHKENNSARIEAGGRSRAPSKSDCRRRRFLISKN